MEWMRQLLIVMSRDKWASSVRLAQLLARAELCGSATADYRAAD